MNSISGARRPREPVSSPARQISKLVIEMRATWAADEKIQRLINAAKKVIVKASGPYEDYEVPVEPFEELSNALEATTGKKFLE
jgi:hypothetical protein